MRTKKRARREPGPLVRQFVRLRCREHPWYRGVREQEKFVCPSCQVILILANQHTPHPDRVLGGLDPYQFIPDLKAALEGLEAIQEEQVVIIGFV